MHQHLLDDHNLLIDTLDGRIAGMDQAIMIWAKADPPTALLTTMPGIGEYSAAVILAEIGEIDRFPDAKHLCSYAGLVPSVRSGDSKVQPGPITKEGSPWLRWIMVNAAQRAPCGNPRFATFFERTAQKQGRKTARIVLARKMSVSFISCCAVLSLFEKWTNRANWVSPFFQLVRGKPSA